MPGFWYRLCACCVIVYFSLTGSDGAETHCKTQNITKNVVSLCSTHTVTGDTVYIGIMNPKSPQAHSGTCSCAIQAISPTRTIHVSVTVVAPWLAAPTKILKINNVPFNNVTSFDVNTTNSAIVSYKLNPTAGLPNLCLNCSADYSIRVVCRAIGSTTTPKTASTPTESPTTIKATTSSATTPHSPTGMLSSPDGPPTPEESGTQTPGDGDGGVDIELVAACTAAGVVLIIVVIVIVVCCRSRRKKSPKAAAAARDRTPKKDDKEEEMYMTENEMYISADLPDNVNNDATTRLSNPYDECS